MQQVQVPYELGVGEEEDEARMTENRERALLYVAATRAKANLLVYGRGEPCEWLEPRAGRLHGKWGNMSDEDLEQTRFSLNEFLLESKLYHNSRHYRELVEFVVRLRSFVPFNAMLLQIQKPGLHFAATPYDWHSVFDRGA